MKRKQNTCLKRFNVCLKHSFCNFLLTVCPHIINYLWAAIPCLKSSVICKFFNKVENHISAIDLLFCQFLSLSIHFSSHIGLPSSPSHFCLRIFMLHRYIACHDFSLPLLCEFIIPFRFLLKCYLLLVTQ
jgi:hypothetical protein